MNHKMPALNMMPLPSFPPQAVQRKCDGKIRGEKESFSDLLWVISLSFEAGGEESISSIKCI